ncbi:MAG: tRNA lysidine(34) synthetase TilS [Clostridia bacterium]|nr:tRNA lysidine(34) synthetase TilS [Clostridia bacterium]
MKDKIIGRVREAIFRYRMLDGKNGILCGFSGGADSSVMLSLLCEIKDELGFSLRAVHVNHGIRGEEADRDEEFCRGFCLERGIEFTSRRVSAPLYAEEHSVGLEEAARELRYGIFEELKRNGEVIATAHNSTDNAETVLFNLIKGSGNRGLGGIPPVRGDIIRPIILLDRDEIREYAAECGVPFVLDSTNSDTAYTRNFIRHKMIPLAKEINPSLERTLLESSDRQRESDSFLWDASSRAAERLCRGEMSAVEFASLPSPVSYRVLFTAFDRISDGRLEAVHHRAVRELAEKAVPHSSVSLPGGVRGVIENGMLIVTDQEKERSSFTGESPITEGKNSFPALGFDLFLFKGEKPGEINENVYKLSIQEKIIFDKIKDNLYLRTRRPGDSYRARGITKSLKKMMSERGTELSLRDQLPVICDGEGIIWVPGFPVCDRVYPKENEKKNAVTVLVAFYR